LKERKYSVRGGPKLAGKLRTQKRDIPVSKTNMGGKSEKGCTEKLFIQKKMEGFAPAREKLKLLLSSQG